jgi:hypothetical protein
VICLSSYARHSVHELLPFSEGTDTRRVLDDGTHQLIEIPSLEDEECVVTREIDGMALEPERRWVERWAMRDELLSPLLGVRLQLRDYG